jgi:hypothetical protein
MRPLVYLVSTLCRLSCILIHTSFGIDSKRSVLYIERPKHNTPGYLSPPFASMPTRQNTPITAENLLGRITALLKHCHLFFQTDLTSMVLCTRLNSEETSRTQYLTLNESQYSWETRLQTILYWSSLALREQRWLEAQGLGAANFGTAARRRHGTMGTFIRQEGLTDDASTLHDLQQGRKLLRLENAMGAGISLLLVPVMPMIRRLTIYEESRVVRMLESGAYQEIREATHALSELRLDYQEMHEIHTSQMLLITLSLPSLTEYPVAPRRNFTGMWN